MTDERTERPKPMPLHEEVAAITGHRSLHPHERAVLRRAAALLTERTGDLGGPCCGERDCPGEHGGECDKGWPAPERTGEREAEDGIARLNRLVTAKPDSPFAAFRAGWWARAKHGPFGALTVSESGNAMIEAWEEHVARAETPAPEPERGEGVLLPCPFCGGDASHNHGGNSVYGRMWWSVGCRDCDVWLHYREAWAYEKLDQAYPPTECLARWNRRAASPEPGERIREDWPLFYWLDGDAPDGSSWNPPADEREVVVKVKQLREMVTDAMEARDPEPAEREPDAWIRSDHAQRFMDADEGFIANPPLFKAPPSGAPDAVRVYFGATPPAPAGEVWQPIETAPKDGTPVLGANRLWVTEVYYAEGDGWYEKNNHSTDTWGGETFPTHWMPLPPAPQDATGDATGDATSNEEQGP